MELLIFGHHEGGHGLTAHMYGGKDIKMSLSDAGGSTEYDSSCFKNTPRDHMALMIIHASGFIAEYLFCGASFWHFHSREGVLTSSDIEKLSKYAPFLTKDFFHGMLVRLQNAFSNPVSWGRVQMLAERLRWSERRSISGIGPLIDDCNLYHQPANDAMPLIDFIVDSLYQEKTKK
ncbi:MAG: hypothetical protein M0Q01_04560 [Syntrophales bacterium]|jgi:hypothetical protein|nr:hypothetical protein [Syntrophales bacterium]